MERASGVLMAVHLFPMRMELAPLARGVSVCRFSRPYETALLAVLPLTTTSYGDSPYQSFSAAAGNPYFIDLDALKKLGYLTEHDFDNLNFGSDPTRVDYGALFCEPSTSFGASLCEVCI